MSNSKKIYLTLLVTALMVAGLFALNGRAYAQQGDRQWFGQFWNNRTMSGSPAMERFENTIDFNWGTGSPDPRITIDNFSARWTRRVFFPAGNYRFFATMDDGMRVFINNQEVINGWWDSQEHTMTVDRFLPEGIHDIRVEYFEATNVAIARFWWEAIPAGGGGGAFFPNWKGEYFNNQTLSGAPVLVRDDRYLNFDWGAGSAAPNLAPNNWSARWTKTYESMPAGQYRFFVRADDGARVFVNDALVVDNWRVQSTSTVTVDYWHIGGPARARVEYFDATGNAVLQAGFLLVPGGAGVLPPTGGSCQPITGNSAVVTGGVNLNVRSGPGTQFEVLTRLAPCQVVPLSGFRNADGSWVQVVLADGRRGWVSAQFIQTGVPINNLTPSMG